MQRWNDLGEVPAGYGPSVVTIGNFDGVHRGHRAVLTRLVARAHELPAHAVAITFQPHPLAVLYPERAPAQLTTLEHRLELLAETGLDAVLVMEFTRELAGWSPERFVREVLVDVLGARLVVVGRDTRFGHRNSGDVSTLRELGRELGFAVELLEDLGLPFPPGHEAVVHDVAVHDAAGHDAAGHDAAGSDAAGSDAAGQDGRRWSSTWVREAVAAGDVALAAQILGRPHRVSGLVVHGDHRGRQLGFPTANLAGDSVGLIPADGVYAGWLVRLDPPAAAEGRNGRGERLPAAISIGTNPTFGGHGRRVEAYVLDRDDLELYGERIALDFVLRLRPTLRFDGVDPLIRQMKTDVEQCHQVLGTGADRQG